NPAWSWQVLLSRLQPAHRIARRLISGRSPHRPTFPLSDRLLPADPDPPTPPVLRELHVKNLAVLAAAAVGLQRGFNLLSGAAGAGQPIGLDSLALLSGVRATADLIRTGADGLTVSGIFEVPSGGVAAREVRRVLEAAGVEGDGGDEVLVRREISRSGR